MINYILFDDKRKDLLPLTFLRPVPELRIGILTIREKWEIFLHKSISWLTEDYLSEKFPIKIKDDNIFINGSIIPDNALLKSINSLKQGEYLAKANILVAARIDAKAAGLFSNDIGNATNIVQFPGDIFKINNPWDIFQWNGLAIESDFALITKGRKSINLGNKNFSVAKERIFLEEGAKVNYSSLNASDGPIYIGKDAEIMEGSLIRGPFAMCGHSVVKMGAKIYGPTTIGPNSKIGGEINNCVIQANTNKAHDGFLGNSVIGEWCNIGADSNNSNLKNNYSEVRLWNYAQEKFISTGLQFCGLIMGDHSKCGINTMFNTGTVVGISVNIFGAGYLRNYVPSFSWGGPQGMSVYPLDKAIETAGRVLQRRNIELNEIDKKILEHIFIMTDKDRHF